MARELNEPILSDDYPVYPGYVYVADGRPVVSMWTGIVLDLKRLLPASEIRRCDIVGREVAARTPETGE